MEYVSDNNMLVFKVCADPTVLSTAQAQLGWLKGSFRIIRNTSE
jgi:hypothetical protein